MKKSIRFACLMVIIMVCLFVGPAFSATIGLRPTDPTLVNPDGLIEVQVGQQFELELYLDFAQGADDFKGGTGLVSFNLTVDWDPLVKLLGVTLPSPPIWDSIDNSPEPMGTDVPQKVAFNGYQFGTPISTDHTLAYLSLECIGAGYTELIPHGTFPKPVNFALDVFDQNFNALTFDDQITFVPAKISQVPIPSTLFLLGGGLVGLLGLRRRKAGKLEG